MFSIVIPLYNKEKYISRAIESVLSQSFKDFELIIVDDGSTDNSLEVVKNFTDSRIRIVEQTNQGVGFARNRGMTEAKYDWIALLDADDAWSIHHLNELAEIIDAFPSTGMVSNKIIYVDTNQKPTATNEDESGNIRLIDYFLEAAKDVTIVWSSSVAISKEAFINVGGFSDEKMGEDLKYWAKIALSYPVAISDKVTSYYFRGTNGVTESEAVINKQYQPISSLRGVSPSVDMLIEKSIEDPTILGKNNIKTYINGRVYNFVIRATFREDFTVAKSYAKLALPQKEARYMLLKLYQITPTLVLRPTKNGYIKFKESLRPTKVRYDERKKSLQTTKAKAFYRLKNIF